MIKAAVKGDFVRRVLLTENISQNEAARRIGVSSGYMTQLLKGERFPSPKTRKKLQRFFKGCRFEQLFEPKIECA